MTTHNDHIDELIERYKAVLYAYFNGEIDKDERERRERAIFNTSLQLVKIETLRAYMPRVSE